MLKKISLLFVVLAFLVNFSACSKAFVLEFKTKSPETNEWVVTDLNETSLVSAVVEIDDLYQPYVSLRFNDEGAKLFEKITGENVGDPLGIFLKGKLLYSPVVYERITGGRADIKGVFTREEAKDLAKEISGSIIKE